MNARVMIACTFVTLLFGLAVACEEKKAETPDAAAVTGSAAPASTTPATTETEEDFEEEAASTINPDNLEAELAKLEAEIK